MKPHCRKTAAQRPLAACIAAVLSLAAPAAMAATTWTVNTCSEANTGSGTIGSLRYAAANAASGDTIDLTNTGCSTISLTTGGGGAVSLAQADITLKGPGKTALTIQASNDRVLSHFGTGTLTVNDLTVANGYLHPAFQVTAQGGCIFSYGKLTLSHVAVRSCRAQAVGAPVRGGGVYAKTGVFAKYSDITGNTASNSGANANGGGGGIFTYGYAVLGSSTLSGNQAQTGAGGGVRAFRDSLTIASTISGNIAMLGGGIYAQDNLNSPSDTFTLLNSTVSGNQALNIVGGAWTNAGTIHVYNSTVAFNTAGSATGPVSRYYGSGFNVNDSGAYYTDINHYKFKKVTLQSSVFSNNTSGTATPVADDFGITRFSNLNLVPISGQSNIVFGIANPFQALPGATVMRACALLGPLRDNGGLTKTHALMSHSPAIDAGNTSASGLSPYDQRGQARTSGAQADMGAYEVQQNDIVFNAGFEGCP
ncbi:MAG: hypothetical protein JSR27_00150 [Proteobacteria bacterium]|nr:hypothetical protein [Pseudomonadota bacterium]